MWLKINVDSFINRHAIYLRNFLTYQFRDRHCPNILTPKDMILYIFKSNIVLKILFTIHHHIWT